jgi:replication initiation and membrane attachment protein DnaB
MPQARRLTDEQEASALALNRANLSIAELARAYSLTWTGMRDCLKRAEARETKIKVSRESLTGAAP